MWSRSLRHYRVNVLIDHSTSKGAPVVYEDNLTYNNLVGRIEHLQQMGVLVTDFTLIKAGALHRANGGYLIIEVLKLLQQPFAWEGLKRALRSGEIRTESLGQMLSLISTVSLEPEPIGGVNEKIGGFFDVCKARGLTGEHGVLRRTVSTSCCARKYSMPQQPRNFTFMLWKRSTKESKF
jgi:predicted ATP-dependent protease